MQIAVVDLGIGNLRSVKQALMSVASNVNIVVTDDAKLIGSADKLVLPGQGAIDTWHKALAERNLNSVIQTAIAEKPLLGICVGMQALFKHSEEDGGVDGFGLFDGSVRHFSHFHESSSGGKHKLKIPHMGWNQVTQTKCHPLWNNIADDTYYYFVHSYCANLNGPADSDKVLGEADFGHKFIAAIGQNNVFSVQFHPEKSHNDGLQLLKNFTRWDGKA